MDQVLANYKARLDAWRLGVFKGEFHGGHNGDLSPKFHPSGAAKLFYGLTVVAFIDPESALYEKLCNFQSRIRTELEYAGLDSTFSFLNPMSLHMTLCDIVAGTAPVPILQLERIIQATREIFSRLGQHPDLSCHLTGIGVDTSLMMLAQFKTEAALNNCLNLEKYLKDGLGVNERSFLGHVSMAYFVRPPSTDLQRIINILGPFSEEVLGQFPVNKISLCHFRDMNHYTALLSLDLLNGSLIDHASTLNVSSIQQESTDESHASLFKS